MTLHLPNDDLADKLNRDCHCVSVNPARLRAQLESDPSLDGLYAEIQRTRPHLFAGTAVYLSRGHVAQMATAIAAIESVVRLPTYRETVMAWADPIAQRDSPALGAFTAFDFHLAPDGPKLIEINTNAGGAMLCAVLARAQHACCDELDPLISGFPDTERLGHRLVEMLQAEWRHVHGSTSLVSAAIVDDAPREQYLHPEFLLFQQLLEEHGIETVIADPADLNYCHGRLFYADMPIQLVYNRLTDFMLTENRHLAVRQAWLDGRVVVTPHPRAHALYADKRNLAVLSDPTRLRALGADDATITVLQSAVPHTQVMTMENRTSMWENRRNLFFKPAAGYGSKAAYRGEKITQRVWAEIAHAPYVAQAFVAASERHVRLDHETKPLKFDIRCFAYDGEIQLIAARLYQGQTTNFRTRGGGFAPVFFSGATER